MSLSRKLSVFLSHNAEAVKILVTPLVYSKAVEEFPETKLMIPFVTQIPAEPPKGGVTKTQFGADPGGGKDGADTGNAVFSDIYQASSETDGSLARDPAAKAVLPDRQVAPDLPADPLKGGAVQSGASDSEDGQASLLAVDETVLVAPNTPQRRSVTIPDLPAQAREAPEAAGVKTAKKPADSVDVARMVPLTETTKSQQTNIPVPQNNGVETLQPGPTTAQTTLLTPKEMKVAEAKAGQEHRDAPGAEPRPQPTGEAALKTAPKQALAQPSLTPPANSVPAKLSREKMLAEDDVAEPRRASAAADVTTNTARWMALAPQQAALAPQPYLSAAQLVKDAPQTKDRRDAMLVADGDMESLRFDNAGSNSTASTVTAATTLALSRPELPRSVILQLQHAARAMADQPVELTLNPQELGRVRLSITTADGGVTLNIIAERPETMDMMRRNADALAQELSDLGFSSVDLGFGQGRSASGDSSEGSARDQSSGGEARDSGDVTEETAIEPPAYVSLNESGAVDVRI